ncbi:MAG: DUF1467 family protein [Alphaproteobacteria bacterium]|nr:DUF1467 family protein [Alphaproteobacteria bacterium]
MNWFLDAALYVIVWWITLFAVLPWGVKPVEEREPGHDPGAPARPNLWKKAIATTLVAAVLWYVIHSALIWELARIRTQTYG